MKVYYYSKCQTCQKAIKYLESTGRKFDLIPIREQPPAKAELKAMLKIYEGKLGKLFNTSGGDYREMKLGEKLPKLSEDEAFSLLSKNGNLVKRPFVLVGNTGAVGFKIDEWKQKGIR
jgi:arsenate reductase